MKTLRNMLLTLSLATLVTTPHLDAMKRQREDDREQQSDAKRQKTVTNQRLFTLICSDNTKIENVSYEVLAQSATLKNMVDDLDGVDAADVTQEIYLNENIDSKTMQVMVKYMRSVADAQNKGSSKQDTILNLVEMMKKTFKHYTTQTIKNYAEVASFLDFELFSQALHLIIAQELHNQNIECLKLFNLSNQQLQSWSQYPVYLWTQFVELIQPQHHLTHDIAFNIQKAHYLSCNKQLDANNPVIITLYDLADYGLLSDNLTTFDDNVITHLITVGQFDMLQTVLETLCSHATLLAIQAHQALVAYVKTLTQSQIEDLFQKLQSESTLKMALRLIYAQVHNVNLDELDCVDFIANINYLVNFNWPTCTQTQLFSQTNLQYALPLLEALIGSNVTMLDLSKNQLTSIPNSIGNLVNLQMLWLYSNQFTSIPDAIGNLVNVQKLDLSNNELTSLPNSIGNLVNVQKLDLSHNKLTSLSPTIGNLIKLQDLWLGSNQLTSLPAIIGNLIKLQNLWLSNNQLTSLPDSIGNLVNLQRLFLYYNQLTSIPDSIGNLVNLQMLLLDGNPLTEEQKQALIEQFGHIINNFDI